jgi:hypothetical protein
VRSSVQKVLISPIHFMVEDIKCFILLPFKDRHLYLYMNIKFIYRIMKYLVVYLVHRMCCWD